jgi:hypothetical protein
LYSTTVHVNHNEEAEVDVTTKPRAYTDLAAFRRDLPAARIEEYRAAIKERLGFDPLLQPRGIGIADATRLAGVLVGTGNAWVRRTRVGKGLARPFPTPRPDSPTGKPLYDPLDVAAWLDWTQRWAPGTTDRPSV